MIASRGNEIVSDDCLQADTPRDARRELKRLLELQSLSDSVCCITEIPVQLSRERVDARLGEPAGEVPLQTPVPADGGGACDLIESKRRAAKGAEQDAERKTMIYNFPASSDCLTLRTRWISALLSASSVTESGDVYSHIMIPARCDD